MLGQFLHTSLRRKVEITALPSPAGNRLMGLALARAPAWPGGRGNCSCGAAVCSISASPSRPCSAPPQTRCRVPRHPLSCLWGKHLPKPWPPCPFFDYEEGSFFSSQRRQIPFSVTACASGCLWTWTIRFVPSDPLERVISRCIALHYITW